jgi:translation initiation factor IF-2
MNVTELARQLRTDTKVLFEVLPSYGFDIGKKAIKVDDKIAAKIIRQWKYIKRDLDKKKQQEAEEKKQKERELRKESGQTVTIPDYVTVRDFAERLNLTITEVITELMKNGILANQNQDIDFDTAAIMADQFGFTASRESGKEEAVEQERTDTLVEALSQHNNLEPRPPVIVVMGHVDHGKTKLLDTIREENVVDGEAGGITQHIGAYQAIWKDPKTKAERLLSFIDTPGHEAFTVMRSRGAKVADIAILVVAADDGVKQQTIEVIQIIRAAGMPFIVALNKIDKETADVDRVYGELAQHNIVPEEWGGTVPVVKISAKEKINIDGLLDMVLLVADMHADTIQADPALAAIGTVIESHKDKNMGPVATVLIQSGTLRKGDKLVVQGEIYGTVRAMRAHNGDEILTAPPSTPVQIIGFKVAPTVGDILDNTNASSAEKINVRQKQLAQTGAQKQRVSLNTDAEDDGSHTLNLVIKADVLGSLEAIIGSLEKIKHDEVRVRIVGKGLGNITEDDVSKAETAGATIIGFNVNPTTTAQETMRDKNIAFQPYSVIYDLIDWVKDQLEELLDAETIVTELGTMKVLAVFRTEKKAMTIGGRMETGKAVTGAKLRVKRNGELIGRGKVGELQQGKATVKQVPGGVEFGMRYEGKVIIQKEDTIEFYTEEDKARTLELID